MSSRTIAIGVGCAVTSFLVAGVVTIELLGAGEAPGTGILGVFVGVVAGVLAGGLGLRFARRLTGIAAGVLAAYAAFGGAFVALAGLQYVNVPGADALLSFRVEIGVSLVVALLAGVLASRRSRGPGWSGR